MRREYLRRRVCWDRWYGLRLLALFPLDLFRLIFPTLRPCPQRVVCKRFDPHR